MIFGAGWMVSFKGMPSGWIPDSQLADRIGVQEIFHPPHWDPRHLAPCIMLSINHKLKGDSTAEESMANDEKRARERFPNGSILTAPGLNVGARQKAPVRIYRYPHGWDMVVYSEKGNQMFVSALHCQKSAQCKPFEPSLAKFVKSLDYSGNVTVINKTSH